VILDHLLFSALLGQSSVRSPLGPVARVSDESVLVRFDCGSPIRVIRLLLSDIGDGRCGLSIRRRRTSQSVQHCGAFGWLLRSQLSIAAR
jgi:hypothetical protein